MMINTFYVEHYKNIQMPCSLNIQPGIFFLYGPCGAGKTNFCMALSDIFMVEKQLDLENRCNVRFEYGFNTLGRQIWCSYTRNNKGQPSRIEVIIPSLNFFYVHKAEVRTIADIWRDISDGNYSDGVKQIVAELKKEIVRYEILIPNFLVNKSNLEWNKTIEALPRCHYNLKAIKNGTSMICDDGDSMCFDNLEKYVNMIKKYGRQGIFVVRRTHWMDDQYAAPNQFYYIENGCPRLVTDHIKKDVRTSTQLRNLLL